MTGNLTSTDKDALVNWIGTGPKTFVLLYSITRDGCVSTTFHQKCDNQGPTVTVLYNTSNSVYGGYTSANWNSKGQYVDDKNAFLFQLRFSKDIRMAKWEVTKPANAIYSTSGHGPLFGAGHDLVTFSNTINNSSGSFALNGTLSNIGHSYNVQGLKADTINNNNMTVTELEVYRVVDGGGKAVATGDPWRKTQDINGKLLSTLMEEIQTFGPVSDLDIPEFRILMLGPVGSGKSSFYNTVNSAFVGRITQRAVCGDKELSTTTAYTPYTVRSKSGSRLKFRLCDTRGLEEKQGLDITECGYLLNGHVPDLYEFNPASSITLESPEFVLKPMPGDKVHCAVFVIDASTVGGISPMIVEKMNNFRKIMNTKRIPQAVVLTKIDKVSKETDVSDVFKVAEVEQKVMEVSKLLGLPPNSIFPVKNYVNEMHLEDNVSALALLALRQMLYFADDYMQNLLMQKENRLFDTKARSVELDVCESDTA